MHARAVKLLRAASELVGGDEVLARRLGVDGALLRRLLSGQYELPERVLLGTVDIILARHESPRSPAGRASVQPAREAASDG